MTKYWRIASLSGVLAACLLGCSAAFAGAPKFKEMVVFGESSSDTGNADQRQCTGGFPLPEWGPWAPCGDVYFAGKVSNGPMWVDFLADWLRLPRPQPSELGGSNYAYAGAKTTAGVNRRVSLINGQAIPGTDVPGVLAQLDNYLAERGGFNKKQLVIIWGGANDLRDIQGPGDLAGVVGNLVEAVVTAACTGARHVMVPNQLNASIAPIVRENPNISPEDVETAVRGFNDALRGALNSLRDDPGLTCGEISLYYVDMFEAGENLVAVSRLFGFPYANVEDTAVDIGASVGLGTFTLRANVDPNDFLFLDPIHVTTPAQGVIAAAALRALIAGAR